MPCPYSPLLGDSFLALRVDEPAADRQQRASGMLPIAFGPEDRSFVEHLADGLIDQDRRRNIDKGPNGGRSLGLFGQPLFDKPLIPISDVGWRGKRRAP